jgi:hypothetical protein
MISEMIKKRKAAYSMEQTALNNLFNYELLPATSFGA